jgi:hypothetical protein
MGCACATARRSRRDNDSPASPDLDAILAAARIFTTERVVVPGVGDPRYGRAPLSCSTLPVSLL